MNIIIEELPQPTSKKCNVAKVVATILETFVPNKIKNKKISFLLIMFLAKPDILLPCLAQTLI